MIRSINYLIQSLLIYFLFIIGRLMGLTIGRTFFSYFFEKFGPFFKSGKIIDSNLYHFRPNINEKEKKQIKRSMWKNYGMTFIEYIFLKNFRNSKDHIKVYGGEKLKKISDEKRSVIFISGHFANFELMSMEITKKNINLATIYRPLNNFFLNPFMEFLRKKYVCQNQIKKGVNVVREAVKYIHKNFSIALMIDQRLSEGERVNFFGKPALTTTLPAQLALKYNLSIIPVFIERINNSNFRLEFSDEITPNKFNDKIELTRKLNEILEKMIEKNPYEWIWTHDRWK